jgi:hypothetical protein
MSQNYTVIAGKPQQAVGYKKTMNKRRRPRSPRPPVFANDKAARQLFRHEDLVRQFHAVSDKLVGRSVFMALPGHGSKHDPKMFRPVHSAAPRYRNRPEFPILTVEQDRLVLSVATSRANVGAAKLEYSVLADWDFAQNPSQPGGIAQHHVLLAAGNNMLQELVNTVDRQPGRLELPALVLMVNPVRVDEAKLAAIADTMPEELRAMYIQKRKECAAFMSHGELFGDAEIAPDEDVQQAFAEQRVYEDYSALLGVELPNPARKILHAANPAYGVLKSANMPMNWAESADTAVIDQLIDMMRDRLPLPELATATDLLDALADPGQPIKFSLKIEQLPMATVIRAMRSTFPPSSAILHHVTDAELITAAQKPYDPLVVGAYARLQVVDTDALRHLPAYAAGELLAPPAHRRTVELA